MAEIEKLMNVAIGDIEKIMNIATDDIEKVMGLEVPASAVWTGTRGILAGGDRGDAGESNVIDYKTISSTGAMSDFGDLTVTGAIIYLCGSSNGTRGVFSGGVIWPGGPTMYNNIQYITVGSTGNTTDAGDLTQSKFDGVAASNGTNGYHFAGKDSSQTYLKEIDYWAIATTNNASDFGDLSTLPVANQGGAINDATYALRYKGITSGPGASTWGNKYIDYMTMASTSDTSDFGDMTVTGAQGLGGCEDTTRGVNWSGRYDGTTDTDTIDYVTVASTGDATDFGDISTEFDADGAGNQASGNNAVSNLTKGEVYGGYSQGGPTHANIDYITIQTTGDATSAGDDLTAVNDQLGSLSGT